VDFVQRLTLVTHAWPRGELTQPATVVQSLQGIFYTQERENDMKQNKSNALLVRLNDEDEAAVLELARRLHCKQAQAVRHAVFTLLAKLESEQAQPIRDGWKADE
jgi:hypothetical protein